MKSPILIVAALLIMSGNAFAQSQQPKTTHIDKGTCIVNAGFQSCPQNIHIDDSFYQLIGLEVGFNYYIIKGLGIKAAVQGQQFKAQETYAPSAKALNKQKILLVSGQVRYNFKETSPLSYYLQTGYSYGDISNQFKKNVKRWEVLSAGMALYGRMGGFDNVGIEVKFGVEKNNLSKKLAVPILAGIIYKVGSLKGKAKEAPKF